MNEKFKRDFIQAGAIARQVRSFGKSLIQKGASYNAIITQINQKILELGARAAFPPQIALNHVAAHFLPDPEDDIILSEQVVKLDVGVCYRGAIGDCAVTVDLSRKFQKLIDAAEAALLAAEQIVAVGTPLREIGKIIEKTISSYGFKPIKNLAGHGLGYNKIHTPPVVPNYDDAAATTVIKPEMTFAIEPFATDGKGFIYESGHATIFSATSTRLVGQSTVTRFLIEKIKTFNGLPFALHDLTGQQFSNDEVRQGLSELLQTGAIADYPPLIENVGCMVAQAENSVLVDSHGNVFITTR
jgi:methionyl aminopeptidase